MDISIKEWIALGYEEETAKMLCELPEYDDGTTKYNVNNSTNSLLESMSKYGIDMDCAEKIIDKFNAIPERYMV